MQQGGTKERIPGRDRTGGKRRRQRQKNLALKARRLHWERLMGRKEYP